MPTDLPTAATWVPALQAVFGGVLVFAGVHVWTADTQTTEQRAAWIANLDKIVAQTRHGRGRPYDS